MVKNPRVRGRIAALATVVLLLGASFALTAVPAGAAPGKTAQTDRAGAWIVQLKPSAAESTIYQRAGDASVKVLSVGKSSAYRLRFDGQTQANDAVARLMSSAEVVTIEPDILLHWDWTPNDPYLSQQAWLQTDRLPAAWDVATGKSATIVAVADTGVRADHPDLAGKVVTGADFYDSTSSTADDYGHGTGVAGVIAARGNDSIGIAGAAMNVQIMPLRVGSGDGAPISAVAQAITYATDHGAAVINLSLGESTPSPTLQTAIQYAYDHNVPVVAAAGNDANQASFPASYPQAISVGATSLDGTTMADFSSRISRVDIAAPGVDVLTTWWDPGTQKNTYATVAGTSFSTPMVTGTIALMKSVNAALTVEQVRGILTGSARPLPNAQGAGAGLLDSSAAVRRALLPSFNAVWQTPDRPVAAGAASRTWEWGPNGWFVGTESYLQTQTGQREVAYFDKARMEITNPYGDPSNPWYVTTGLLANELITGQLQTGDASFVAKGPAQVPVAGDPDDTLGPTYASFTGLTGAAPPASGATITQTLSRAGQVGNDPRFAAYGVTAGDYVPDTNHRVASVFRDYLASSGTLYLNGQFSGGPLFSPAYYASGFPITEAYWAQVKVRGAVVDVLIQCFQRRCLTYTPSNPAGWQVELGNVGRHYYTWRYGQPPPAGSVDDPTQLSR